MQTSYLRKAGVIRRTFEHPVAATISGLSMAALCAYFASVQGTEVMVIMAVLGGILGASMGAMLAASNKEP
jgi:phosphate/sulfate permease